MAEERVQRRLAAILAADVVGYSRLMEHDEAGTLAALKARRKEVLEPLVARHRGRIFKVTGDGVLVEFGSAVNAVQCAVELQHRMAAANAEIPEVRCIVLRVGVNLGDVMIEGSDVYGDGVNIAARLEGIAEPGGVLVSGTAFDYVKNKADVGFEDLGAQPLKNIAEPVRVYRVAGMPRVSVATPRATTDKPAIAVLPFVNMSGDPEQQYFSDGITEDIITELSRFRSLTVIARNSSFQYRDNSADVRRIGRDLGAEYVVEGSVRRVGNRIRVTVQLIEAASGNHLWAERYDRKLEDIFDVQDEIVHTIVGTFARRIEEAGARSAGRKRPENLAAYDYLLRGIAQWLTFEKAQTEAAQDMFEKALALDPTLAPAYGYLAARQMGDWWVKRSPQALERAYSLTRKAVAFDENDAFCHQIHGYVELERHQFDRAEFHIDRSIALNPNDPDGPVVLAALLSYTGRSDEGVASMGRAFRLDPYAPQWYHSMHGMVLYAARRYAEALATFGRITASLDTWEHVYIVASYGRGSGANSRMPLPEPRSEVAATRRARAIQGTGRPKSPARRTAQGWSV